MAESVKVAVRVRPFNAREIARNATLIIDMQGNTTLIKDPDQPDAQPKSFAFDYSYWSHNGSREREDGYLEPADDRYVDQAQVFQHIGMGIMDNAWKGFNCSLFAYGQTGAGKSYSVMGYGNNKGVVPIFCDQIFKEIEGKRATAGKDEDYAVTFSMMEIYNEQVRDLLNTKSLSIKGGLKIRQHPSKGFVVENMTTADVHSYKEIDNKMNDGNKNRTVAATQMNATSSRAHTIIALTFSQKYPNEAGQSITKAATINLVDLAGSERAESTGATGDRLKEGSAINQSLSSLGNVIKALADQALGKKKVIVPYRDSSLTKLLQNALGGNSKTIMIAALSPADINYDETLSTLRFADRAKSIKTKATVNESPTEKLIRELREENKKMMEMLKKAGLAAGIGEEGEEGGEAEGGGAEGGGGGGGGSGVSSEEVEEMRRQMEEQLKKKEEELANLSRSYEERMEARAAAAQAEEIEHKKEEDNRQRIPHFWNLNEDPALCGMIVHFIDVGVSKVGNKKASPPPQIQLNGLSIVEEHAVLTNKDGKVSLLPGAQAHIMLNGQKVDNLEELKHNDRVSFGPSHLFVFHHPQELAALEEAGEKVEVPTFDTAQEEIAKSTGLMVEATEGQSKEDLLLQEDLIQMLPMVAEANGMAEALKKKVKFEITLVSSQAQGLKSGRTEVMVKMTLQDETHNSWLWDRNKFINRKYIMQEIYQNYVEGDKNWDVPKEKDPFWDPPDLEKLIGTTQVLLQPLAYNIELAENLAISDYKGKDQGNLDVEIIPCNDEFEPVGEEDFVEDPKELLGKPFYCKVLIKNAHGLPMNIDRSFCRYKFYHDKEYTETEEIGGTMNPVFEHEKRIKYKAATKKFLQYLQNESLFIEVWGRQKEKKQRRRSSVAPKGPIHLPGQPSGVSLDKRRRSSVLGKSGSTMRQSGSAAPLPPIAQESMLKEALEMFKSKYEAQREQMDKYEKKLIQQEEALDEYKEKSDEIQKKWKTFIEYVRKKKLAGEIAMMVEDFEALLAGKEPPCQKVELKHKGGEKHHHQPQQQQQQQTQQQQQKTQQQQQQEPKQQQQQEEQKPEKSKACSMQ